MAHRLTNEKQKIAASCQNNNDDDPFGLRDSGQQRIGWKASGETFSIGGESGLSKWMRPAEKNRLEAEQKGKTTRLLFLEKNQEKMLMTRAGLISLRRQQVKLKKTTPEIRVQQKCVVYMALPLRR